MVRRSSYRLGRRLKASRRDRLDYVTYLQSDGMPTRNAVAIDPDDPRLRELEARMSLGGLMTTTLVLPQFLGMTYGLGGTYQANIFPPVTIKPSFELGGGMRMALDGIPKQLGMRFGLGGEMECTCESMEVMLAANFGLGGSMATNVVDVTLAATFGLGGTMSMSGAMKNRLRSTYALGGTMTENLDWSVGLGMTMALGGDMETGVALPPVVPEFPRTKMANPAELPTGNGQCVSVSPDGNYVAVGHLVSPFLTVYHIGVGNVLTKLANPAALPGALVSAVEWAPDSSFLLVCSQPGSVYRYDLSGSGPSTILTQAANFNTHFTGAFDMGMSADGNYLVVGTNASPYIFVFSRAGNVFTKLPNPASLPAGTIFSVGISSDGTYIQCAPSSTNKMYKRTGTTLDNVTMPAVVTGDAGKAVFSHNDTVLALAGYSTPFFALYDRVGDTFTKKADPASLPNANVYDFDWWPYQEAKLVVSGLTTGSVKIYDADASGNLTLSSEQLLTAPAGPVNGADFSASGDYLYLAHNTTPYISVYQQQ